MTEQKVMITREMRAMLSAMLPFDATEEWIDAHYDVYETMETHDRLGSLNERARNADFRVAKNPEIPGLRGLGQHGHQVFIDEPYHSAETLCIWREGDAASEWLEHRVFCDRDVLTCLSREAG